MSSMGYLGMISVPIPRLRTESADADEVSLLFFPIHELLSAVCLFCNNLEASSSNLADEVHEEHKTHQQVCCGLLASLLCTKSSTVSWTLQAGPMHNHNTSPPTPCTAPAHFLQTSSPDVDSTLGHTQTDSAHTAAAAGSSQGSAATAAAASEQRWRAAMSVAPAKTRGTGGVWGRSPHLGVGWKCVSDASAVTEVHLRRLDVGSDLHRRVVAVLTVDATPQEVRKIRQVQGCALGRTGFREAGVEHAVDAHLKR